MLFEGLVDCAKEQYGITSNVRTMRSVFFIISGLFEFKIFGIKSFRYSFIYGKINKLIFI